MSILTVTTFLSLDGVMQGPGGPEEDRSNGFDRGGWLVPYFTEEGGGWVADWFSRADSFLLGRKTYQIFERFWPQVTDADDPVASRLNTLPKYVVSKTLDRADWANSTVLGGDVVEQVRELKSGPGREIQVHGSGELLQTLMAANLVDEYRLWIFPVVVGAGKKLFRDGAAPQGLELVDSKRSGSGVTVNSYRPGGELRIGSFLPENP